MSNRMPLDQLETYLQRSAMIQLIPNKGEDRARLVMSLPENVPYKIVQACEDWAIPFELGDWQNMPD